MAKKINTWMISTLVLAGIIIGTGIGIGVSQLSFMKKALAVNTGVNAGTTPADTGTQKVDPKDIEISPVGPEDHVRGAKNPKVTFVEYSDTECPFCLKFHPIMQKLVKAFPDDVQWVYRHLPLTDLHPKAMRESVALECAGELGGNDGFWTYLDRLQEITPGNNKLDPKELYTIAAYTKLDAGKFSECLDSGRYDAKINAQIAEAAKNGGNATPFSVVIGPDAKKYLLIGQVEYAPLETAVKKLLGATTPEAQN